MRRPSGRQGERMRVWQMIVTCVMGLYIRWRSRGEPVALAGSITAEGVLQMCFRGMELAPSVETRARQVFIRQAGMLASELGIPLETATQRVLNEYGMVFERAAHTYEVIARAECEGLVGTTRASVLAATITQMRAHCRITQSGETVPRMLVRPVLGLVTDLVAVREGMLQRGATTDETVLDQRFARALEYVKRGGMDNLAHVWLTLVFASRAHLDQVCVIELLTHHRDRYADIVALLAEKLIDENVLLMMLTHPTIVGEHNLSQLRRLLHGYHSHVHQQTGDQRESMTLDAYFAHYSGRIGTQTPRGGSDDTVH